jgi:hypothetical protein
MYNTKNLKWEKHTQYIKKKINPIAGIFRKIQNDVPLKMKRSIFFLLFHSHIQYGITMTCSYDNIQKVQNKAIKNLYGQPFKTHTNLIHNQFNILQIKEVHMQKFKFMILEIISFYQILKSHITTKFISTTREPIITFTTTTTNRKFRNQFYLKNCVNTLQ